MKQTEGARRAGSALEADVGLERYGIEWRGPHMPISLPMPDGYWTPWHLAQDEIERLRTTMIEGARILEADGDEWGVAHLLREALPPNGQLQPPAAPAQESGNGN